MLHIWPDLHYLHYCWERDGGYSGDNGSATNAELNRPSGVAIDAAGNSYIADSYNQRIRKVSNGVITTVAGSGSQGLSGDNGSASNAQLNNPSGIAVDSAGNLYSLYIADTLNNRVRFSNGLITTVAGNSMISGECGGFSGDNGPATSAELGNPRGVAMDSAGKFTSPTLTTSVSVRCPTVSSPPWQAAGPQVSASPPATTRPQASAETTARPPAPS